MEIATKGRARPRKARFCRIALCLTAATGALIAATAGTQDAIANGDTRTLSFFHTHTREKTTVTFRRNGQYDSQALSQLNWFLRDWRVNEQAKMDPQLFDILWEVYREVGSSEPIHIISAYRSPETNGALRRRSSGVSEHSQHMRGKAMDVRMPDVDTGRLRAVAMRMQYGGVGYYPSSEFVHVDTGSVRAWPRMSQDQLVRLFPDGKTLHLPPSGKPLAGYEVAKAEILPRNAALASQAASGGGSLGSAFASLFSRRNAPPEPAERPAEPAPRQVASISQEAVQAALTPAPLPPRRPEEPVATMVASLPAPPSRPVAVAALAPRNASPEAVLGNDAKAAARALFDPRTSWLDLGFSPERKDDLTVTRFSGPAVKPLPVLRQAQLTVL